MVEDPAVALAAALERLYLVFRSYGLKPHIEGCPCCVYDEDQDRVRSRSLRALTAEDFDTYASKALTTWGDADDLRHFLPRLLELVTGSPGDFISNEIVLSKLATAGWRDWPAQEQEAVESVLSLRWNVGLTHDPSEFDAGTWLCGAELAGSDVSGYIDAWRSSDAPTAFEHLAAFITSNPELLTEGRLANPFCLEESQVAQEMQAWVTACLADADFQERLAGWYQGP